MEIEPFQIDDYEKLLSLWDRTGLPYDRDDRDSRDSLENQIFDDRVAIYILRHEGALIGSVIASSDGRKGWINRLAIDPEFRGRRLAARLVDTAERFLFDAGVRVIAVLVEQENLPSIAAFCRCGYETWPEIVYLRKELK